MTKRVLVTGGAGYIGSHVCVELINAGHAVLIVDDFSNAHPKAIERIRTLVPDGEIDVLECDLANPAHSDDVVRAAIAFNADSAIHLAGLKAVGESVAEPEKYYRTNIGATFTLLDVMRKAKMHELVFSSSATVYGDLNQSPVEESGKTGATNPYGRTKLFIEEILKDIAKSEPKWRIANLRYFNPVGAHPSGEIGEDPEGVPNNLFPFIAQVAVGKRDTLQVFGDDYPTIDGTGVRDYIHVCDLAEGHVAALTYLLNADAGATDINLGAGRGYSVLEAVTAFKRASNRDIPYRIAPRRDGDIAEIYANANRAKDLLDWQTKKTLDDMCADHWRWQSQNPNGYRDT